jgi:hypothetical protein
MADVKVENIDNFQRDMALVPVRRAMSIAIVQAVLGVGAAALAVIGLEHFAAVSLLAIATIVVGAALLFEGGVIAARFSALASFMEGTPFRLRGWMTTEFIAGVGGITLGILALLHFAPFVLVPVAAMALGAAQMVITGLNARLNAMEISRSRSEGFDQEEARESIMPYTGIGGIMGLGALVVGLIALAGINPVVLGLVAILSIAAAHLVNGAMVFRMLGTLYRRHAG